MRNESPLERQWSYDSNVSIVSWLSLVCKNGWLSASSPIKLERQLSRETNIIEYQKWQVWAKSRVVTLRLYRPKSSFSSSFSWVRSRNVGQLKYIATSSTPVVPSFCVVKFKVDSSCQVNLKVPQSSPVINGYTLILIMKNYRNIVVKFWDPRYNFFVRCSFYCCEILRPTVIKFVSCVQLKFKNMCVEQVFCFRQRWSHLMIPLPIHIEKTSTTLCYSSDAHGKNFHRGCHIVLGQESRYVRSRSEWGELSLIALNIILRRKVLLDDRATKYIWRCRIKN